MTGVGISRRPGASTGSYSYRQSLYSSRQPSSLKSFSQFHNRSPRASSSALVLWLDNA